MSKVLRIVPLGGLGEIGKNMMAVEYGQDILIIDVGVMFPENDMLGIDLVIPDWTYLRDKFDRVVGIVITHGHEDHIGALPYLLREMRAPIYATRLALGFIENKLKRQGLAKAVEQHAVQVGDQVTIGTFQVEFLAMNHSIPDGVGLAIRTPAGLLIHSGDFKFDYTPTQGVGADFGRLAELSREGVLALLADSTGAERPGFTPSEKVIDPVFDEIFREAPGRIIIATFSSLISRVQQVINCAARHGRKVALAGYSLLENVRMAQKLGYLEVPAGVLVPLDATRRLPPKQVTLLVTGSQGEPGAALARIARGEHRDIDIVPGDTVILSANPIPGNEEVVARVINKLFQRGAEVIYPPLAQVHVSGHASQEEQKLLLALTKPKYFIPIHGELRHLHAHARTAKAVGMPPENIFIVENGTVIEFEDGVGRIGERVPGGYVFVDGSGVGDVGPAVLRDREALARDGFVIAVVPVDQATGEPIGQPAIVSRGFVYVRESSELLEEAARRVEQALLNNGYCSPRAVEMTVKDVLGKFLYDETHRRPMILPVITEI
ncbi:MAG TPA: ribonuclease J [Caldilineae bacterium]|nr:ribonuclease J [Caldilineae bacterium]